MGDRTVTILAWFSLAFIFYFWKRGTDVMKKLGPLRYSIVAGLFLIMTASGQDHTPADAEHQVHSRPPPGLISEVHLKETRRVHKARTAPHRERNYSVYYVVFAGFLFLGTMWAVVDEVVTRRPWKDVQRDYRRLRPGK